MKTFILTGLFVSTIMIPPAIAQDHGHEVHMQSHQHATQRESPVQTPDAIVKEHKHLHHVLETAAKEEKQLGETARHLHAVMAPHFAREEEIAMPPLGLLKPLAYGEYSEDMKAALPMTQALREKMPEMLKEHEEIVKALNQFRAAAKEAERDEYVEFADKLKLHAQHEEQVLYPAALLVGKTLEDYFEE